MCNCSRFFFSRSCTTADYTENVICLRLALFIFVQYISNANFRIPNSLDVAKNLLFARTGFFFSHPRCIISSRSRLFVVFFFLSLCKVKSVHIWTSRRSFTTAVATIGLELLITLKSDVNKSFQLPTSMSFLLGLSTGYIVLGFSIVFACWNCCCCCCRTVWNMWLIQWRGMFVNVRWQTEIYNWN